MEGALTSPCHTDRVEFVEVARAESERGEIVLRRRIELFASLPMDKLTRLALQERLDAIGQDNAAMIDDR